MAEEQAQLEMEMEADTEVEVESPEQETESEKVEVVQEDQFEKAESSAIILFLIDLSSNIKTQIIELEKIKKTNKNKLIVVLNKTDISNNDINIPKSISISAKNREGIDLLKEKLLDFINISKIQDNESIVTNLRHFDELSLTLNEVKSIIHGLDNNITGDFLAINIRQALFHLGSITGEVTTDTLLANIFGKFCIGK